jgi:O-antigen ligase
VRQSRTPAAVRLRWDPLRIGVFALTLITISRIHQHFSFLQVLRPAMLLVAFVALYALLNPRLLGDGRWMRRWPAKVVVAMGVLACISAPFGISLGASAMFIIESYSKVLVFAFILMAMIRGVQDVRMLTWAYVVSSGILVVMALFLFDMSHYDGYARLSDLYTYDANDLGLVLLVGLGLTLLALQTSRGRSRIAAGAILVGIGMAIARSGSRGAFVALAIVGGFLLVSLPKVSVAKRIGFVMVALLALAIGAPPGYWKQMNTITKPTEDYNWDDSTGRRQIFLRGMGYMAQYPVFGLGINNFPRAEGTISERARNWDPSQPGIKWVAPHNSYVQAGSEVGVPGLILFGTLIFGGIVSMRRLRRRLPASWADGDPEQRFLYQATVYLPVSFVGFAVSSFFVSFAYSDPIYYLAAMMVGVYVSVEQKLGGVPADGRARQLRPRRVAGRRTAVSPVFSPAAMRSGDAASR